MVAKSDIMLGQFPEELSAKLLKAGITLYDHQQEGVSWMMNREQDHTIIKGGCLSDDPGLGKTNQMLATILANSDGGRNLIIAPVSLMNQWRDAAQKIFPDKRIRICHGKAGSFDSLAEIQKIDPFITIAPYSQTFHSSGGEYFPTVLHQEHWERVILDEAHILRNHKSKVFKGCSELKANIRWALTGTPIQNTINDLVSIFKFLHVPQISIQSDFDTLKQQLIKRRNKNIMAEAYKVLNLHIEDTEFLDDEEKKFYEWLKLYIAGEFAKIEGQKHQMGAVFELLLRLRQATIHPKIVFSGLYRKLVENNGDKQTIDEIYKQLKIWSNKPSTKITKLIEKFTSHENSTKSLIVSHFTEESNIIYQFLQKAFPALRIEIFDGSLSLEQRNDMVKKARLGEIDCMIIQIQCGGVGLNLQMFNKVYIVTPDWNPSNEIQAIARCHRIGQTSDVEVVKLIIHQDSAKPTIDEKIILVQQIKRDIMADHLIDETLRFNERTNGKMNLSMKDFAYLLH
jgi:SNF2 family DNA or RNA helicase